MSRLEKEFKQHIFKTYGVGNVCSICESEIKTNFMLGMLSATRLLVSELPSCGDGEDDTTLNICIKLLEDIRDFDAKPEVKVKTANIKYITNVFDNTKLVQVEVIEELGHNQFLVNRVGTNSFKVVYGEEFRSEL